MMRICLPLIFVSFALDGLCSLPKALGQSASEYLEVTVAPGFTFEPIALAPLTKWPVLVEWDPQGHLLVVESGGVAHPIMEHNRQLLHRLVRLIDENGDGVMDRRELVADELPFTEGILCLGSRILVSCPPVIYQLTDGNGDGFCEQREVWFDGQTITGCANDLHGPYLGRDGWVYWSKGAFAQQRHELLQGGFLEDKAAHIYRRRLTGGAIEPVMSGGMDNPVGFAVLPNGERFFSSTFLVHPGDGMRDGVVHAIYGGTYGKDHSALDKVVRTGPLMPIMIHLGPAAPSGMTCLRNPLWPENSQETLVVTLFNHRKLTALPLQPTGSTYQARAVDLVVGNRIDFHPTDVLEDMDGSLIVVDTGGWYDLCCPSSRVDQELAAGGIYRLKNTQSPSGQISQPERISQPEHPRTRSTPVETSPSAARTVQLLDDSRPWVARSALLRIVASGDWATEELKDRINSPQTSHVSRRNAVWALGAIGSSTALDFISHLLSRSANGSEFINHVIADGQDLELWHIACHLISLHRYSSATVDLQRILIDLVRRDFVETDFAPSTFPLLLLRAATEALGRIGDEQTIDILFSAFEKFGQDRFLDHSIRYALFEIGNAEAVASFLGSSSLSQRELALATLDLLKAESFLTAEQLVHSAQNDKVGGTATRLLVERPELVAKTLGLLGAQWRQEILHDPPSELFRHIALGWRGRTELDLWIGETFSELLRQARSTEQPLSENQSNWLECVLRSRIGQSIPVQWHGWMTDALRLNSLHMTDWLPRLNLQGEEHLSFVSVIMSRIADEPDTVAKEALLLCLPPDHYYDDDSLVEQQIWALHKRSNEIVRAEGVSGGSPWKLLKRLKISAEMAARLLDMHPQLQSAELSSLIEIISSVGSEEMDRRLLTELRESRAARSLPIGSLVNAYRQRPESVRSLAQEVTEALSQSDPDVKAQVQSILEALPAGDPVRGLSIYHGTKVNCGGCHQMGYLGGRIGPELSRIGASRTREALLEAILFPNERIEQGFQATQVLTIDGQVFNGIPTPNSSEHQLELRVAADRLEMINTRDIEDVRPSEVSIMPGGLLEQLSHQDLADLLSLLEAAK